MASQYAAELEDKPDAFPPSTQARPGTNVPLLTWNPNTLLSWGTRQVLSAEATYRGPPGNKCRGPRMEHHSMADLGKRRPLTNHLLYYYPERPGDADRRSEARALIRGGVYGG